MPSGRPWWGMSEALNSSMQDAGSDTEARRIGRFHLEVRQNVTALRTALTIASGLVFGVAISVIILIASGVPAPDLINEFVVVIFTSARNVSAVLEQAAPLIVVGLAASLAFKARFWNIGIEGQMIFGAIGATAVAMFDIGPESTRVILMALAAALGGIFWIALPTFLKLRLGINEIISTLLLNYVALNFLLHLLYGDWQDPVSSFPHSEQFEVAERLADLGWENLNWALVVAVGLTVVVWILLSVTRFGYMLNFVYANPKMAAAVGIPVTALAAAAALGSGALAGLAGFTISAGIEYRMTQSFFLGYGFSGILIAFLARNNPIGTAVVAVFVAVLMVAGQSLQVFYQIPFAMVQLIQAIVVICVAASDFFVRHRLHWMR